MKTEHVATREKMYSVFKLCHELANAAKECRAVHDEYINNEDYSEKYRTEQINNAQRIYQTKHSETREKIIKYLEEIEVFEKEAETVFPIDNVEFANALSIINTAQENILPETIESFKLKFAGEYQLLLVLEVALKRCGIDTEKYKFSEYTEIASIKIYELIKQIGNLELSEISIFVPLNHFMEKLSHFGEVRGIIFPDETKTLIEFDDKARDTLARHVMNLPQN